MNQLDSAFLSDYVQFGYMNHVTTAIALYNAGLNGIDTAAELRYHVDQVTAQEARKLSEDLNDASRVQKLVFARLLTEYVAAVEELGAMCEAIRHRGQGGIFLRFINSSVGQVADFYQLVLDDNPDDLGMLLRLPSVDELTPDIPTDELSDITNDYRNIPSHLFAVASSYRKAISLTLTSAGAEALRPTWKDDINILLGRPGDASSLATKTKGWLVVAADKMKHRSAIVERIDLFANLAEVGNEIPYLRVEHNAEAVETWFQNILSVALYSAEVATLLLALDGHRVNLDRTSG